MRRAGIESSARLHDQQERQLPAQPMGLLDDGVDAVAGGPKRLGPHRRPPPGARRVVATDPSGAATYDAINPPDRRVGWKPHGVGAAAAGLGA